MADKLYVEQAALEGMIGAFNGSQRVLNALPTEGFIAAIEPALPGSGLGAAFMRAGVRARLSVRGVAVQLKEINDAATASIAAYNAQQAAQSTSQAELAEAGPMDGPPR
ncbi:hypothetical protein ACFXK0_05335 [Nocardia sp. NPDC059177]|uniref:hypothetical protein n=1 Tax=Nocardia sp. NPDC059177 TaxID=3346759 RepID=UPI00369B27E8